MVSLLQKYRPRSFDDIRGQPQIIDALRHFVKAPYSCGLLFFGGPGLGKSSTAEALANELGINTADEFYGGYHVIPAGRGRIGEMDEVLNQLRFAPRSGSGWRLVVTDECDAMTAKTEMAWLDTLDNPPDRAVFVFTTNAPDRLSPRFLDRMALKCEFKPATNEAEKLIAEVWWKERMGQQKPPTLETLGVDGTSFRAVMAALTTFINRQRRASR